MNRWKAASCHLLLSLLVIGGIALLALRIWFPFDLYRIAAPDRLLYVMLVIDLVVGPLLTLVVYRRGKPSLRFDLTVIALCQLAFLGYGLHTLWASRPVFLVATPARFNLVFANELDPQALMKAPMPQWRRLAWFGPTLVGALPPVEEEARQRLLFITLETGVDLHQLPERYVDYAQIAPRLLARAEGTTGTVKVPVLSSRGNGLIELDARTGQPLTTVRTGFPETVPEASNRLQQNHPAPNR